MSGDKLNGIRSAHEIAKYTDIHIAYNVLVSIKIAVSSSTLVSVVQNKPAYIIHVYQLNVRMLLLLKLD